MTYEPEWNIASQEEDEASSSSLELAPWVAPRAAAIRELHMQARAAENADSTRQKVMKWRRGICEPRGGRHEG